MATRCTNLSSKYYGKADFQDGERVRVTIARFSQERFEKPDGAEQEKWVLWFHESEKGLSLNQVNREHLIALMKTDVMEDWIGQALVLYVDPTVMMGAKMVGGIRVQGVETGAAPDSTLLKTFRADLDVAKSAAAAKTLYMDFIEIGGLTEAEMNEAGVAYNRRARELRGG